METVKNRPILRAFQVTPAGEMFEQEFLSAAASVETLSSHWIAEQIVKVARRNHFPTFPVIGFKEFEGAGAGGAVEISPGVYRAVVVGKFEFLQDLGLAIPELLITASRRWIEEGSLVVYAGWDEWIRGIFRFDASS